MAKKFPGWATEKQKEGMEKLLIIAEEFGSFEVSFKNGDERYGEDCFIAVIEWDNLKSPGRRHHEMPVAWDYQQMWDRYGEEIHEWQFAFADGDCCQTLSTTMFYIDLFFFIDGFADTSKPKRRQ